MDDKTLIKKFTNKYNLSDKTKIFYTDGSKTDIGSFTGIGIVRQDSEEGFQININKKCSVYTAELLGIWR